MTRVSGKFAVLSPSISSTVFGAVILVGLFLTSFYSYLLFHSLAELFSVAVAGGVFMFSWNSRRHHNNNYLLFIGISFLFVGLIALIHSLAYKGMGVFRGATTDLPTQLWIANRYLLSISFLVAPFFVRRKLNPHAALAAYALATGLLLASIFVWDIFPTSYVEGAGLTPFKIISEYIISLIFVTAIILLIRLRSEFSPRVLQMLIWSIVFMIATELAFTTYISVYSYTNLIGHTFQIISFYMIYRAIIQTGLIHPYDILLWKLKQSEEALRQQTRQLEARNEELGAFAHTVAHDLKNPLSTLLISAKVLEDPDLTAEEQAATLDGLQNTVRRMSGIIDALMLLAEVRRESVPYEPLDMKPIVEEAKNHLAEQIHASGARITEPQTWPAVQGYSPWLEQVWVNYISNAIKYGGSPPYLELGFDRQPDGTVRFWLRDNGPGIPPHETERLFEPFTQLNHSRKDGFGLGLSIVRRIIEKSGGEVGVESQPGEGSLFFFTLPAAQEKNRSRTAAQQAFIRE